LKSDHTALGRTLDLKPTDFVFERRSQPVRKRKIAQQSCGRAVPIGNCEDLMLIKKMAYEGKKIGLAREERDERRLAGNVRRSRREAGFS
jgi:hypothetical protein